MGRGNECGWELGCGVGVVSAGVGVSEGSVADYMGLQAGIHVSQAWVWVWMRVWVWVWVWANQAGLQMTVLKCTSMLKHMRAQTHEHAQTHEGSISCIEGYACLCA